MIKRPYGNTFSEPREVSIVILVGIGDYKIVDIIPSKITLNIVGRHPSSCGIYTAIDERNSRRVVVLDKRTGPMLNIEDANIHYLVSFEDARAVG